MSFYARATISLTPIYGFGKYRKLDKNTCPGRVGFMGKQIVYRQPGPTVVCVQYAVLMVPNLVTPIYFGSMPNGGDGL